MGECSSSAKTSVWWDIDKCAVPRGRGDPHRIAYNIIGALAAAGYVGPVSIAAYGDAARVAPPVLHALSATGICLTHVPAGSKDTSDKRMLVDMLFWAFDNPPPGNFLLISGDRDFSDLLHRLRMKRYNILLVRPSNASSQILAAAAKTVWLWESIAAGEALRPESPPASSMLGCKLNVHNASDVLGCKPNLDNSDTFKCSQNKILLKHGKGDDNVKASRLKPLQKYVKKATGASGPTENQDRVESVGGVSESSVGNTTSELDQSFVSSSSSSSCNSNEGVLKPNLNNLDPLKCSQNKILQYAKGDANAKASNQCRLKPLQKYVKKATGASSPTENQDRVGPVGGVSESSITSTATELDQSSVPSSSSSSSCYSNDGVNTSVLLETPVLLKLSPQEHVLSTQPQQVEAPDRSILGERPSKSTECVARNGILNFGGNKKHDNQTCQHQSELQSEFRIGNNNGKTSNRHRVKPLQKYVKKTNTTFCSASNQVDSVQVTGCPKGITKSEVDGSSVSSSLPLSSSEILKAAKTENSVQPGSSTRYHSLAKKSVASARMRQVRESQYIFVKKPSISVEHGSRIVVHDFNVSTVHYHPTSQQSKSSEAQNKIHPHSNMGGNNVKSGNGYKLNQQQMYVKKVNVLSASTSNVIAPVHGFPDNPRGSTSSHPSQSMSASSSSETLHTAKLNQSHATTDNLHQDYSDFIFGKKDGTSGQCTLQNGTSAFGFDNSYFHPTYHQFQSSLLAEQNISTIPHPHDVFGDSHSINSQIGSSAQPSVVSNGVSSTEIQAFPSGSTFQGLDDICLGISRLNISECSRGTVEVKPLFQGNSAIDTSIGMASISGDSKELPETRSSFHRGSDTSCFLNYSIEPQTGQPLSSDYTCRNFNPPNLSSDMQNPGQHGEKPRYVPNSPDPEGTIGHILHALDILKAEKILPTESNIADCIRYGEMNLTGFDVKKALELGIRHQAVVMKKLLNDMPLFVPKDESLWKCVNVTNSKAKNPIEALDTVHKYISSVDGHLAVKNSQSRYQAATILKGSCLQHYALGDVLQVLHIIIVRKKWLMPHSSGWQPLSLNTTGVIAPTDATGKA